MSIFFKTPQKIAVEDFILKKIVLHAFLTNVLHTLQKTVSKTISKGIEPVFHSIYI